MRRFLRSASAATALLASLAFATSCAEQGGTRPTGAVAAVPNGTTASFVTESPIRVSEFHYDNAGGDTGEQIEITGPAGSSLIGWTLALYNGSPTQRNVYATVTLSGTFPDQCSGRGVLTFPAVGLQNGNAGGTEPDGFALVNGATVIEFLSYEGSFTAVSGPAAGLTSTNVGVLEAGTESASPVTSLQRSEADPTFWVGPVTHTFTACNTVTPPGAVASVTVEPASATIVVGGSQGFTATAKDAGGNVLSGIAFEWSSDAEAVATVSSAGVATGVAVGDATISAKASNNVSGAAELHVDAAPPPGTGDVRITELHYDNAGTDVDERVEVTGPAGFNLAGWSILLYNGNGGAVYGTIPLGGVLSNQCDGKGTAFFAGPASGIQNGSPDGLALINAAGAVVEFLSYEGSFTASGGLANGLVATDIQADQESAPIGRSLQRDGDLWFAADQTFGSCNPPAPPPSIQITGRVASDVPLPVGYEDQLFAELRNAAGVVVPMNFTWSSETPEIATIDQRGVFKALSAGTAVLRATGDEGTTSTISLPTAIATPSGTAMYAGNTEFGVPTDADASDDFMVVKPQYTASFNKNRGIPNWVSFNLEQTHFGDQDRCDCFTFDPTLPESFPRYNTADYTGAGAFHGFGIDRGHLARSFDRTAGSLDNAHTFLFTNIIPQASDNNQGPWSAMEFVVGDLARLQNKELYVIAGASGGTETVKNEGKIVIPAWTWKVVVVLPRDQGLSSVDSFDDVEVIAVIMPNTAGIRNVNWETYRTTVDAVEALSGYDLLSLLPDQVEIAVESGTKPPTASLNGPFTINEGGSVNVVGSVSDADGDAVTVALDFGDGQTASGSSATHPYAQNGSYTITLTATDTRGLVTTATTTASVNNAPPAITSLTAAASVVSGVPFAVSATFSDAGALDAPWHYSFAWGEGTPTTGNAASQSQVIGATHTYLQAGTYALRLTVTDKDGGSSFQETLVTVNRLVVAGDVNPTRINTSASGQVIYRILSSASFDAASIDAGSARIAGVSPETTGGDRLKTQLADVNGDGRPDLSVHFSTSALVAAGALTGPTSQLVLLANLTDGRQIESRAAVLVR
jgi:DNA/RNA endonuclease G (NUC1)